MHPLAPLAAFRQFIPVRLVPLPDGSTDKLPLTPSGEVTPKDSGGAFNPAFWMSWQEAHAIATALGPSHTVGFAITKSTRVWCLDIDGALQPDNTWSPLAQQLIAALPGCAVELSQSGRGLHLWGFGDLPEHAKKRPDLHIELYDDRRFIALGTPLSGAMGECPAVAHVAATLFPPKAQGVELDGERDPSWVGPEDDDELIRRMLASTSTKAAMFGKAQFTDLWNANVDVLARLYPPQKGHDPFDRSGADMALANHLAFWTGRDQARMLRLVRRSALYRDKWEREDYVKFTMECAARQCREVYRDPRVLEQQAAPVAEVQAQVQVQQQPDGQLRMGAPIAQPFILDRGVSRLPSLPLADQTGGKSSYRILCEALQQWPGVRFLWDEFKQVEMVENTGTSHRYVLDDSTRAVVRLNLERAGFNKVPKEDCREAIAYACRANTIDTAREWAEGLVWDGQPRIAQFFHAYLGAADTEFSRAVALYFWSALAGRALISDGSLEAHMVPVLVGGQGAGKSRSIKALAPSFGEFGVLDFSKKDDDLARETRGKQVMEIPELKGVRGRDSDDLKAYITKAVDSWVPKYREDAVMVARRCIFFGTTNNLEFLVDLTGNRRWLPVEVGVCLLDAIARDRLQLWAEAVALFKQRGVCWEDAARLGKEEVVRFEESSHLCDLVDAWLQDPKNQGRPLQSVEVATGVGVSPVEYRSDRRLQREIAQHLNRRGYVKKSVRLPEGVRDRYVKLQ